VSTPPEEQPGEHALPPEGGAHSAFAEQQEGVALDWLVPDVEDVDAYPEYGRRAVEPQDAETTGRRVLPKIIRRRPDAAELKRQAWIEHRGILRRWAVDASRRYWSAINEAQDTDDEATRELEPRLWNPFIDLALLQAVNQATDKLDTPSPDILFVAHGDADPADGIAFGALPFLLADRCGRMGFLCDPSVALNKATLSKLRWAHPSRTFAGISEGQLLDEYGVPKEHPDIIVFQNAPLAANAKGTILAPVFAQQRFIELCNTLSVGGSAFIPHAPSFGAYREFAQNAPQTTFRTVRYRGNAVAEALHPNVVYVDRDPDEALMQGLVTTVMTKTRE
jgi:hypothetical protein